MNVAVIGGGLAGLAAGGALAERGHRVTLLERRPWAGGKTYSFVERETGASVDNGQHIFMPCMTAYVDFLARLGTLGLTRRQRRMRVPVFDRAGRRSDLWAAPLPAPLHLAPAFARYRHLTPAEKARVARGITAILRVPPHRRDDLDGETFGDWLRHHGQTAAAIRDFWDLIVIPALNCPCDRASAAQAVFVFQEGFLKSSTATAICLPAVGLSALHVAPAVRYLEARGGTVRTGCGVERLEFSAAGVEAAVLPAGERVACDAYVAALPPRALLELLPAAVRCEAPFAGLEQLTYSPIVNLHLWFDGPVADFDFAAFTGSDIQWIFNRTRTGIDAGPAGEHLVISLSAADRYVDLDKKELQELFLPQVQEALPRARARRLVRLVAIKEPDATFVPSPRAPRPGARTPVPNLFLAGAYSDTGWPATMESAVRSGLAAAAAVNGTNGEC